MPIDYNEYKPIRSRMGELTPKHQLLPELRVPAKYVENFETAPTASDRAFAQRRAADLAGRILRGASTQSLQEVVNTRNPAQSQAVKQAASTELAKRGLKPSPAQRQKTPDFPTSKSIGTPLPEVSRLPSIPKLGAVTPFVPAIVGALLQKPVGAAGEAFGRNVLLPFADKVDELLGLRPSSKAQEALDRANERYEKALKQKQARDADSARINNNGESRLPDTWSPPFTGGQSVGVNYTLVWRRSGVGADKWFASASNGAGVNWWDTRALAIANVSGGGHLGAIRGVLDVTIISGNPLFTVGIGDGINTVFVFAADSGFVFGGTSYEPFTYAFEGAIRRDGNPDTGGNVPNPNPVIQPSFPPNPSYPTANDFPYRPTITFNNKGVDGAPIPQLAKENWDRNGLKPFAEPITPERFNALPSSTNPESGNNNKVARTPSGFPQIQAPPTAQAPARPSVPTSFNKPSFTARPFVSGESDPSEISNPRDINSGLTRSEQDAQWQAQNQSVQDRARANERAAAANDAKSVAQQLANLSDEPRSDLGGKSARQQQTEAYQNSIRDNPIRSDAFRTAQQQTTAIQNTTPNTPVSTGNNVIPTVAGLAGIAATVTALKIGSDLLVNNSLNNTPKINNIAQNTTPAAQQTNAKQGVCDAMQPDQCGFQGVQAATNPIKDIATANNGLLGNLLALLNNLITFLQNQLGKILTMLNNGVVDRTIAILSLVTNIHNSAMLTRDIGETLGGTVDNVLSLANLQFKNSEGAQVPFSDFIGANFRSFLVQVLGAENYASLVLNWQKANTIYHSGMAVINTTQSMLDPISSAVEYGMENVSKLGNAAREDGLVSENAYPAMDETIRARRVNRFERLNDTLEGAENISSNLSNVTSNAVSVKEDFKQLRDDAKVFKDQAKAFRDDDTEARVELKASLPTDITAITIAPAPTEDN